MNANTAEKLEVPHGAVPSNDQIENVRKLLADMEKQARGASDAPSASAMPVATAVTVPVTSTRRRRKGNTMTTTHPVASQAPNANAPSLQSLIDDVTALGVEAGKGKDTQIKFLLKLSEAGYLGSLDTTRNKHGDGIDDAVKLSEAYYKAQQGAKVFDRKADNQRKLASTARKAIEFGSCPKWGTGQPIGNQNQLVTIWRQLRADPAQAKRLQDVANVFLKYARVQLKHDQLLSPDELRALCFKKDADARTGVEVLESIRKLANKLAEGKVPNCPDALPDAKNIANTVTKMLAAIAKANAPATQAQAPTAA